jgi:hypothetical protein
MIAQTKTVMRDAAGNVELGPHLGWLTLVDLEGRDVIPIFTSETSARDYLRATNEEEHATALPIRNLVILAGILQQLLNIGFAQALTVDPAGKVGKGQAMPLAQFVSDLLRNMGPPTQP